MEDLLPLITLLIVVGGGLLKAFTKGDEEEDAKKEKTFQPNQSNQPIQTSQNRPYRSSNEIGVDHQDQKKEQLARLRADMGLDSKQPKQPKQSRQSKMHQRKADIMGGKEDKIYKSSASKITRKTKFAVAKNISKEGLAESVIMAEVLGAPRSKRPYNPRTR